MKLDVKWTYFYGSELAIRKMWIEARKRGRASFVAFHPAVPGGHPVGQVASTVWEFRALANHGLSIALPRGKSAPAGKLGRSALREEGK